MSAPAVPVARWAVRLLGAAEARRGSERVTHFGSRAVVALLARLALAPRRVHPREELIELLWPGVALDVGRNRLRQALFTLRQVLEAPGPWQVPVLEADRLGVRLVEGALDCDVPRFEAAARAGDAAGALALYGGELLPGFYDEWIHEERLRLEVLAERLRERATAGLAAAPGGGSTPPRAPASDGPRAAAWEPAAGHGSGPGADLGSMPAPAPAGLVGTAWPAYLTRTVGRATELAALAARVRTHRLVTVLGPGGAGKTRLAVELATAMAAAFDVTAFVPLVACTDPAHVLGTVLAALRIPAGNENPLDRLADALGGRRTLLVLDNLEQLGSGMAAQAAHLVARTPGLQVLATSRRPLDAPDEHLFELGALAGPDPGAPLAEIAAAPAVSLFIDRARAVRADFHASATNAPALVELVGLLDGLPLAIELAAARVRSLPPAALARLLRAARAAPARGATLDLLQRRGPRGAHDPRHASMEQVIAWSWQLLEPPAADLLANLSVFAGGFTLAAADIVGGLPAATALDALVAHSLVRAVPDDEEPRYTLLEPVREFAGRHLPPAAARAARARHRAALAAWAAALPDTPDLGTVRRQWPDLLAALASAVEDGDPAAAVRLCLPLRRVAEDVEPPAEALAALEAAVDACADAALASQGRSLLGPWLYNAGRKDDALRLVERGLADAPPDAPWRPRALHAAARVRWRIERRPDTVVPLLDEAERLAPAGDLELRASLLALRAFIANARRDSIAGQALHAQALALWMRTGNRHAVNSGLYNLAVSAHRAGRPADTVARLDELLPAARALQDWRRLSQGLNVRGNALMALRRWPEAVADFQACVRIAWQGMALHELAYGLWNLPRALVHVDRARSALEVGGFIATFWESRFGALSDADRLDLRRLRRLARCRLDAPACEAAWARGAALTLAEAVARALDRQPADDSR